MNYQTTSERDCSIITLTGDIDLQTSPQARQQILDTLQQKRHVLVDMSMVDFIDSSGVASLVEGFQYAQQQNLTFALIDISESTTKVLQLARLDQVFAIYSSVDEGVAAAMA